ncbi:MULTISPECIES: hypothetical protein [Janibacter]|uniref:NrtR DNA-binding winged helix domain-containing protein n=1 Tax=Janibacter melonis TaxID=262209 RepID=A0A5P8FJN0_9MICO|nr:hypothetical protein [Janibacter melonis]MCB5992424.1 hypothetical protein [Janibacter melonis]QFQ29371.2 hypothetical protein EEW87_002055 [Janibacter melonis]
MPSSIAAELVAVILSVDEGSPRVLASGAPPALPHGPLEPEHRSLQAGLRAWTREREGVELGFVEQLYTFADVGRSGRAGRTVAISYLGLTRAKGERGWLDVYDLLPWEDARDGVPELARELGERALRWAGDDAERLERARHAFGMADWAWRPELVLQRYELLWEAGLVAESGDRDGDGDGLGPAMLHDHRRILATGLARLRSTLQYRPVIFELMPPDFTLGGLQATVESLAGQRLHKQNFRRTVQDQLGLVEPTGETERDTGGRPAALYRFRSEVHAERRHVGTKLPRPRTR